MSLKDEQYKWLAEQAYWIDSEKYDKAYAPELNEEYPVSLENEDLGKYKLLQVEDNQTKDIEVLAMRLREVC
ncbi:hypothetical protein [Streptococcus fryi]